MNCPECAKAMEARMGGGTGDSFLGETRMRLYVCEPCDVVVKVEYGQMERLRRWEAVFGGATQTVSALHPLAGERADNESDGT